MNDLARTVLALLALCLGACHVMRAISNRQCHETQPYMKATSVPPLVVPSGLDAPDTTNALRLPALKEPAPPPRPASSPCLDEPPSFKVQQPVPRAPQA